MYMLGELRDNGARYFEQHPTALMLFNETYTYHLRNDTVALENLSHHLLADGFQQELLDEVVSSLSAAGDGSLGRSAGLAAFPRRDLQDGWYKLTPSPGIELCLAASQPTPPMTARVRSASRYDRLVMDAVRASAPIVYVATPGLGNCFSLGWTWSLLVAELCESAPTDGVGKLHATLSRRVASLAHLDPAFASQITAAQSFERLYNSMPISAADSATYRCL